MRSKLFLILVLGMFSPQGYPEKSFAKIFTRGMVGSFGVVSATPSVPLEGKDFVIRNQSDSSDVYFSVALLSVPPIMECWGNGTTGNVNVPANLSGGKFYKFENIELITDRNIKSMIPGDLLVAGCFSFFGGCLS